LIIGQCYECSLLGTNSSGSIRYDLYSIPSHRASCFSGSQTVQREDGGTSLIADLKIGDKILSRGATGALCYSEVVALPHSRNEIVSQFVEIETISGKILRATAHHMLPSGVCNSQLQIRRSIEVQVGDCVETINGTENVVSIRTVVETGLYTVITVEDFIVVNDVVVSPFAVSHAVGSLLYSPLKLIYSYYPKFSQSEYIVFLLNHISNTLMFADILS